MTEVVPPAGQRAAAEYVRQLLLKPGRYRQAWQQQVVRPRDDVINQMAVTEVIAGRLRAAPIRSGDAKVMPYQLRDMVSDVLSGRQVSRRSLLMFIDGFGFTEDETARLWQLWNGATTVRVIAGTLLHRITGVESLGVNSAHHQAVKAAGPGLVIDAVAEDGVVEGIEDPRRRFCLGVQWHPEFEISEADRRVFRAFVEASGE